MPDPIDLAEPETLDAAVSRIVVLGDWLTDANWAGLDPIAEQHCVAAAAALALVSSSLKLAALTQAAALGAR